MENTTATEAVKEVVENTAETVIQAAPTTGDTVKDVLIVGGTLLIGGAAVYGAVKLIKWGVNKIKKEPEVKPVEEPKAEPQKESTETKATEAKEPEKKN